MLGSQRTRPPKCQRNDQRVDEEEEEEAVEEGLGEAKEAQLVGERITPQEGRTINQLGLGAPIAQLCLRIFDFRLLGITWRLSSTADLIIRRLRIGRWTT